MRTVAVKQLPEILSARQGRKFFREIQKCMDVDRPRMVLDCSKLQYLDKPVVLLLLCCLEEAMKCKGDVKLAALPSGAEAVLELTGVDRLFDIYDTIAEAVDSFHHLHTGLVLQTPVQVLSQREPDTAA
jgi:anti-sigma B factor antagonist